jgi:presqualene diphosphate synthase
MSGIERGSSLRARPGLAAAPGPAKDEAKAIARRVRATGSAFRWAMRLLPAPRRTAMCALCAFCREVDDIADGEASPILKQALLLNWRTEIARLYAGRPCHIVTRTLSEPVRAYSLRSEDFLAIIDGVDMDARADIQAPSLAELDLYCARATVAVALIAVRIFGVETAAGERVAVQLGRGLQLTTILRNVSEDGRRNRLYLPRELLRAHGIEGADPRSVLVHPALPNVCRDVCHARREALCGCDPGHGDLPTTQHAAGRLDTRDLSCAPAGASRQRLEMSRAAGSDSGLAQGGAASAQWACLGVKFGTGLRLQNPTKTKQGDDDVEPLQTCDYRGSCRKYRVDRAARWRECPVALPRCYRFRLSECRAELAGPPVLGLHLYRRAKGHLGVSIKHALDELGRQQVEAAIGRGLGATRRHTTTTTTVPSALIGKEPESLMRAVGRNVRHGGMGSDKG